MTKPILSSKSVIALGPMPARVVKISNKYRYRLILKCKNNKQFRSDLGSALSSFGKLSRFGGVSVYVDINPQTLI